MGAPRLSIVASTTDLPGTPSSRVLRSEVNGSSDRSPIRFHETTGYVPMSMTWQQVDDYRAATRRACGSDVWMMGRNPATERAFYCDRL